MNHSIVSALTAVVLSTSVAAYAQDAQQHEDETASDAATDTTQPTAESGFTQRLVLDDARTSVELPKDRTMRVQIHGEYQARYTVHTDPPLQPTLSAPEATSLGQRASVSHWLRLKPRVDAGSWFSLIAQVDAPYGFFLGQQTQQVGAASRPMAVRDPMRAELREIYLQAMTPVGLVRLGQQTSHWGTGMLVNDGDHANLFGDYYDGGTQVERILFATRPLGKESPLAVLLAGDLVRKDVQADLNRDDIAWQGTLGTILGDEVNQLGLAGIVRRQHRDSTSVGAFSPYTERLNIWIVDGYGKFAIPIVSNEVYLFGEGEVSYITGSTNYVRTPELAIHGLDEQISMWGGLAKLGVVKVTKEAGERWGQLVGSLEWGYATGDANPNDGEQKRFNFEPNHRVGLVLFNQVLAWETARSATAAADPVLVNKATPGLQFYPSNGGVFGATYIYPTFVVRPQSWLDLKAGMLLARTTADRVDPYRFGALGQITNAQGGDPSKHDLGLELDMGMETRVALKHRMTLQVGVEGGVFFPGHAFDDANGTSYPTQGLVMSKMGLQF